MNIKAEIIQIAADAKPRTRSAPMPIFDDPSVLQALIESARRIGWAAVQNELVRRSVIPSSANERYLQNLIGQLARRHCIDHTIGRRGRRPN